MTRFKTNLLLSYICMASVAAAIITPALPQIETLYALGHGAVEWVISTFLLGYVVGQLVYGPLANRYGRLSALRVGLVIHLMGVVLCIVSVATEGYILLLVGRFVTALGAAAGLSCTFMLLNELLDKASAKHAMSFAVVSFTIGIGLAVTLGGFITQYAHWQLCFWGLLVYGTVMLIATWQFPETLVQKIPLNMKSIVSGYGKALGSPVLWAFSITVGFASAIAYCYSAAAPIYAQSILGMTPDVYGCWNLINMLGMLASGFLSAHLMKRYKAKRVLSIGFSLLPLCLLSLGLMVSRGAASALWFFTTTMSLYLLSGLLYPAASYFASNAIEDRASASSMMSFINMSSAMVAVIVMGYLPLVSLSALTVTLTGFFILAAVLAASHLKGIAHA